MEVAAFQRGDRRLEQRLPGGSQEPASRAAVDPAAVLGGRVGHEALQVLVLPTPAGYP